MTADLAIGLTKDDKIMCAPVSAVKKHCKNFVEIIQGNKKKSEIAKIIQKKIGEDLDDISRALPGGELDLK